MLMQLITLVKMISEVNSKSYLRGKYNSKTIYSFIIFTNKKYILFIQNRRQIQNKLIVAKGEEVGDIYVCIYVYVCVFINTSICGKSILKLKTYLGKKNTNFR